MSDRPDTRALLWQPRLAILAMLLLGLLLAVPVVVTACLSLQQDGAMEPFAGSFGLRAWGMLLADGDLQIVLARSVILAMLVAGAASLLALAPAYMAAVIGGPWRQLVLIASITTLLGDQVTMVMAWSEIGRQLVRWLVDPDASSGRYAVGGLMTFLAETQRALPLAILCQTLAMSRRDPALVEAGLECGASHGRLLRWLLLPLAVPGLLLGGLLAFCLSLGAFLEPALLNTGAMSLGERLQQVLEVESNWPQGARLAMITLAIILAALCLVAGLLTWQPRHPHRMRAPGQPMRQSSGVLPLAWQDPLLPAALLGLGLLILPLAWMLVLSSRYLYGIAIAAGPGLLFHAILGDPRLLPAIGNSLLTAMFACLLAGFAGAGLAAGWRKLLPGITARPIAVDAWRWRQWLLLLLSALPLVLPSLVLSTLHLATHLYFASYLPSGLGLLAVALADALRATPLVAVLMLLFWRHLPPDLDESRREFALDRQRLWRQILQPSLAPAWPIALLVAAMLSIGDFQLSNSLSGDRVLLGPSLLAGIATLRSPLYLALIGPLLLLTAWLSRWILTRLDAAGTDIASIRATQGNSTGLGLSMNITARKT
jgi:ABC-type spermidine/putrescine transport system permease subunit II